MREHDQTQINKRSTLIEESPENKNPEDTILGFSDNRASAIVQRKLQGQIETSARANHSLQLEEAVNNHSTHDLLISDPGETHESIPGDMGSSLPKNSIFNSQLANSDHTLQRVIINVGDDKKLADKDGASIAKRTNDDYIEVPLGEMEDGLLATSESPITILMHGSTLSKDVMDLADLLRKKGFARGYHGEIVLITYSGDRILKKYGQDLANSLNATIHAAYGRVVVSKDGIPTVTVKKDESAEVIATDYTDNERRKIPREAEGWSTYSPQIEVVFLGLKQTLVSHISKLEGINDTALYIDKDKAKLKDVPLFDNALENIKIFFDRLEKVSQELKETQESVNHSMEELDDLEKEIHYTDNRIGEFYGEYLEQGGTSKLMAKLDLEDVGEEAGPGWGFSDDELALPDKEATGSGVGEEDAGSSVISKKSDPKAIIQRKLTGKATLPDKKTLAQIASKFNDIKLVMGVDLGIDLDIEFGDTGGSYAVTTLWLEEAKVGYKESIVPANSKKLFRILIQLSAETYRRGQNAEAIGSMYSTLAHKWELHGRQHAINIAKLRENKEADLSIDHAELFVDKPTGLDKTIGDLAMDKENAEFSQDIINAYVSDAINHVDIMMKGWNEKDNNSMVLLVRCLQEYLASYELMLKLKPEECDEVSVIAEKYGEALRAS